MFEFGWLNIGSLMLGLIAWILPVVNLLRDKKREKKKWIRLSLISVSTCAISICFQIFYIYYLVKIEDWSALMDTIGAMAFASAVLIIVTIILNAFTIILYRERTAK
jgi:biotin transporter BioY